MSLSSNSNRDGLDTLLLGLDAACFPVIEDVLDTTDIPTIKSILDGGVAAPLRSQFPPWTASAWPSIYTGVNPGKHGVFDFLTFDGYDSDVVNRTDVNEHALWELLDRHGLTSVVVNVPVTHPPVAFDGALVPGYVAPEDPECHPPGVLADIRAEVGEYTVYARGPDDPSDDERIANYRRLVTSRGEAFRYLADRFEPDFGFLQFQQTDTVFHELPGHREAVRAVYRAVDREIDRTLMACEPARVFLVSDHGIGEYSGYGVRINDFLHNEGYLETVRGGPGMPSWSAQRPSTQGAPASPGVSKVWQRILRSGAVLGARVGLTSQRVERVLDTFGLSDMVVNHLPTAAIRAGTEQVDFPASSAYMRSRLELGVRLNLSGREPEGSVHETNYEAVRERIAKKLRDLRTPEGEAVFDAVLERENVFTGPYTDRGPDLVTVPADFEHMPTAVIRGEVFGPPDEPWEHKPVGLIGAVGPGIDASVTVDEAHIFDVAPTVLAAIGVPVNERMDGRQLPFVEPIDSQSYPAVDRDQAVATADPAVEQRLVDIGYLDSP